MLTPAGAALLRTTRDYLLAHPDSLDMSRWSCCIAHHLMEQARPPLSRLERLRWWWASTRWSPSYLPGLAAARLLGFDSERPCRLLFGDYAFAQARDVRDAALRIDLFLIRYGYPAYEHDASRTAA